MGFQKLLVYRSDFQLAACRRLDVLCDVDNLVRIEIKAYNGVIALRVLRLLLDAQAVSSLVKLGNSVTLGGRSPCNRTP